MNLVKYRYSILLILLLCTCLVAGVGAAAPSSADGNIAFEQYWYQLGSVTSDDANEADLHPLLQWKRDYTPSESPGISGYNTADITPADPPAELFTSSDLGGPENLAPAFTRSLSSGFIPNAGQYDPAVVFILQYQRTTLFFTQEGLVLTHNAGDKENRTTDVIRQTFGGASPDVSVTGLDEREGRVNYYVGNDSSQWQTDIPVYGEILYEELYPGIDLVYSEENGRLKREFRVAPGASPDLIEILYDDGITPAVDDDGILRFASPAGEMLESPLICWQVIGGEEVLRTAEYLIEEGSVRIAVEEYDPGYELVIDPELLYSTYLGGDAHDYGSALAPDGAGGVWIAGGTSSTNFPVTPDGYHGSHGGSDDAFVSRFSSSGALLYSTYLGGSYSDYGSALAPDGAGGVWVAGNTRSSNFPVTDDAYQMSYGGGSYDYGDAFVSRFSSSGALLYSTYLGGDSRDQGNTLAPDGDGDVWITGFTESTDFPVTDNAYLGSKPSNKYEKDAFVSCFSSDGVLLYSTYLGGSFKDVGSALAPDGAGGVWVAGYTSSNNFPITADAYQRQRLFPGLGYSTDAFVSRFSSTGDLIYSTFLGAEDWSSEGYALAPDGVGGVWVAGGTGAYGFPVTDDAYQESKSGSSYVYAAFVSRFSSTGALLYSTYLGGSSTDEGYALAPDGVGGVWVAGRTFSTDFPVTDDAYQMSHGGGDGYNYGDAFVSRFSSEGALLYSTYLGGNNIDSASVLASDGSGDIWVTGKTQSNNFPVTSDAYQGSYGGGLYDAFISRFSAGGGTQPLFRSGDTVEVQNTLGVGLVVRNTPAGDQIDGKPDGARGVIIGGPQTAEYQGVTYTWWQIRWTDGVTGWSAQGEPGGVSWLKKISSLWIDTVTPAGVINTGRSALTVNGNGFEPGASIQLQHSQYPDQVLLSDSRRESSFRISTSIDFTQATAGFWDVTVVNQNGQKYTKQSAVHVSQGALNPQKESLSITYNGERKLWIDPFSAENSQIEIPYFITPSDYSGLVVIEIVDKNGISQGKITETVYSGGYGSIAWDGKIDSTLVNPAHNPYTIYLRVVKNNNIADSMSAANPPTVFVGRPVVFVHGIFSLAEDIENSEGFQAFAEDYYAVTVEYADSKAQTFFGNIPQFAKRLERNITQIKAETGAGKVDIVAHSMGGLVSRYYIEKQGGRSDVGKLIMVQTPNHGSEWADLRALIGYAGDVKKASTLVTSFGLTTVLDVVSDELIPSTYNYAVEFGLDLYDTTAAGQMTPYHQFIVDLNGNERPTGQKFPYSSDFYMSRGLVRDQIQDPSGYMVIASQNMLTPSHCIVTVTNPLTGNALYQKRLPGVTNKGDCVVSYNSAKLTVAPIVGIDGGHLNPWGKQQVMDYLAEFLATADESLTSIAEMYSDNWLTSMYQSEETETNMSSEIGFWSDWLITNISQSEDLNLTFTIEPVTTSARFLFLWDEGTLSLSFTAPNGTVTDTMVSEDQCEYSIGAVPGTWNVTIHPVSIPGDSVELTAASHQINPVIFEVLPDTQGTNPGDALPISVYYGSDSEPCTGATVTATVKNPDESLTNLTLYDDGSSGDDAAGDGVYSNTFTDTAEPGTYLITANGSWTFGNVTLSRTALSYVTLMEYPDLTIDDITVTPQEPCAGEEIEITATISNIGSADATNVSVAVYADINSLRYDIDTATLDIPAGDSISVTAQWKARTDLHTIVAVITSCDEVTEESYSNNIANATVNVKSSQMGLESANITIRDGGVGSVPIILTNCTDLQHVTGTFAFNNSVVEFINVSSTASSVNYANTAGLVRFNITYDDEVAGDISVANIVMRGVGEPGEGTETKVIVDAFDGLGLHSATMIGSNEISLIENLTDELELHANFIADVRSGTVPLTVQFNDTSTGNPSTWLWTFGDGNTSTEQYP
ncbi:MAG TPA: SBBP repeat-containing protein, partial [Methanoculleus thermophilus]|nr:SBBP repeat-containing protein [Methanoculleus thermophilus]